MAKPYTRHAIYWTPEPGSVLAAFGERWFAEPAQVSGLAPEFAAAAVKAPARYGLHATLKAPFPLRADAAAGDLQRALEAFCAKRRAPCGGAFVPAFFQGGWFGLVLSQRTAAIDWLAAECATHFDTFRAPGGLSGVPADGELSAREAAFAEEFGYPYVLSAFQFHVTLAGPLDDAGLNQVAAALQPHLVPFLREPAAIEGLTLLGEREDSHVFEIVSRHPFRWNCAKP
jgi:hypothetical protein